MGDKSNALHRLTWHDGVELLDVAIKGEVFGKHSHDSFAIGFMEQGVGGNFVRGTRQIIPQNAISLMNPDELHTGFSVTETLKYKMLYVSEESMRRILGAGGGYYFHTGVEEGRVGLIGRQFCMIASILNQPKDAAWQLAVDGLLTDALNLLMERYAVMASRPPGRETLAMRRAKEFLDAHALALTNPASEASDKSICLKDLAAMVGLQQNYFLTAFKKHIGTSPYAYWMTRRMQCAKQLLAAGHASVDVVEQLGFHDQAHFVKTFKRFFGVTPGQFFLILT